MSANAKKTIAISLGNRCSAAGWAVDNNLRERKENGYKTCPFDLCVTNYKGIVECIKDDFKYLTSQVFLSLEYYGYKNIDVLNSYPGQLLIYNKKYNFCFNHESPCHGDLFNIQKWPNGPTHYIDDNYKFFIERYNIRIENFRNYLNDPNNHIMFLFKFDDINENSNDCLELKNVLSNKYPKLDYSINIIP